MRKLCLLLLVLACGEDKKTMPADAAATGDGSGSGSSADAAVDAAPLTLDCQTYCNVIGSACQGTNQQYASTQNCLDSCVHFMPGALTDTTGNTLGCRIYHADAARSNANAHCEHAGPGGGGMCGVSICEGFCTIAEVECPNQWQNCPTQCAQRTSTPPYNTMATGNTIQCRLYHLTMAATDPVTHCPHTRPIQSTTCN